MNEISEEVKRAYSLTRCAELHDVGDPEAVTLATALRDTLARALRAEFELDHYRCCDGPAFDSDGAPNWCEDEQHDQQFNYWQAEAHKLLMGEK